MVRIASSLPVLVACGLAGGCAIHEMKVENERLETQVRTKEDELARTQQTQVALQDERTRLMEDLRTRELTIAEMKARLDELQRLNASTTAATAEERQQRAARDRQLEEAASHVRAAELDTTASQAAKAKRLEDVRRQLRKTLELMANS